MSELVPAEEGRTLAQLDEAKRQIALAREMSLAHELKDWRDKAAAMAFYAKSQDDSLDALAKATEIKLRAEAALGAIDRDVRPEGTNQHKSAATRDVAAVPELGVAPATRANWRKLGKAYDEGKLDELIETVKTEADTLSTAAVVNLVKRQEFKKARKRDHEAREVELATVDADAQGDGWRILGGDFRERLAELPDGSVDLILTDPPYPAEFMPLWSELSKHAARVLSPQGVLCALTGTIYLPEVMARLGEHLQYGWTYVQPLPGQNSRIMGRHIMQAYKPWLAYSNGAWPSGRIDWHGDVLDPSVMAKGAYRWQQDGTPTHLLIESLCPEGGTVLDPYLGSGSYGVAARQCDRNFIGVEADAERVAQAASRMQEDRAA